MDAVLKLLAALDSYVPVPTRAVDKPFLLPIKDVFDITGLSKSQKLLKLLIMSLNVPIPPLCIHSLMM